MTAKGAAESRESEGQRPGRLGYRANMGVGSRGSCRGGDRTQEKAEGAVRWAKTERGRCRELPGHWQAVRLAGTCREPGGTAGLEHAACM